MLPNSIKTAVNSFSEGIDKMTLILFSSKLVSFIIIEIDLLFSEGYILQTLKFDNEKTIKSNVFFAELLHLFTLPY